MNIDEFPLSIIYGECALDIMESDLPDDLKQLIFNQMQSELLQLQEPQKKTPLKKSKESKIRIPTKSESIENNSVQKAVQLGYQVTEENKQQLIKFVRMQGAGLVDSPQLEHAIHLFFS
jgi:predicted metalloprotease with PDZ domain